MSNYDPANVTRPIPTDLTREQVEGEVTSRPAYEDTEVITSGTSSNIPSDTPRAAVVQLREEELVPVKEWVETGAVLIRKGIETYPQAMPVEVLHEEVQVEHVPVNRVLAEGENATPWQDGDTFVIPVVEEELVVTKRLVVREELRVTKVRVKGVQEVSGTVRREIVSVETEGRARVWGAGDAGPAE